MNEGLERLLKTIDKMDAAEFVSFLTDDASFKFGNAPAVCGKTNIQKTVADFFSNLKGLHHHIIEIWEQNDVVICEGEVTYTRRDNTKLTLPFVDILRMKGELISDYRIYMDISPLFLEAK